jgi:hypothetical protein
VDSQPQSVIDILKSLGYRVDVLNGCTNIYWADLGD